VNHSPQLQSRRAFATMFAVVLIGLVAAALTASAVLLSNDVRRTATICNNAQLRQLLLAGTTISVVVENNQVGPNTIPDELSSQGAFLNIEAMGTNVYVTASFRDRQASEILTFRKFIDKWELTDTELGPVSAISPKSSRTKN
jgi:hypothetical protein